MRMPEISERRGGLVGIIEPIALGNGLDVGLCCRPGSYRLRLRRMVVSTL